MSEFQVHRGGKYVTRIKFMISEHQFSKVLSLYRKGSFTFVLPIVVRAMYLIQFKLLRH